MRCSMRPASGCGTCRSRSTSSFDSIYKAEMLWHLVLLAALNMPPGWKWPPSPQMKADGEACLARLDELGVIWSRAPATPKIATPIYLPTMEIGGVALTPIWKEGPFPMDCFLAAAFAER